MIVLAEMGKIIETCADAIAEGRWNGMQTAEFLAGYHGVKPSTVLFCADIARAMIQRDRTVTYKATWLCNGKPMRLSNSNA